MDMNEMDLSHPTERCPRCHGTRSMEVFGLGTACVCCFVHCDDRAHLTMRRAWHGDGESEDARQREQFRLAVLFYRQLTAMAATSKPDLEEIRKTEDEVRERVDAMSPLAQATAYLYLHASGMSLDKARDIRRKAGATQ